MTEATERGVKPEERLAKAILVAAREDDRRRTDDGFEWYASADEMAQGLMAALRSEGIYLVSRDELAEALHEASVGCSPGVWSDCHHKPQVGRLLEALDQPR